MKKSEFTKAERELLLGTARASIRNGLEKGEALVPGSGGLPEALRREGASFVTLQLKGRLRGCIGSLEAHRPLAEDVAENAYSAAFGDPRFRPLSMPEFGGLDIHISVLTPSVPFPAASEKELLEGLRPDVDGLILRDGWHRATFLPSVWESLADPKDFLSELKMKAGLAPDHWSETIRFERYEVVEIH